MMNQGEEKKRKRRGIGRVALHAKRENKKGTSTKRQTTSSLPIVPPTEKVSDAIGGRNPSRDTKQLLLAPPVRPSFHSSNGNDDDEQQSNQESDDVENQENHDIENGIEKAEIGIDAYVVTKSDNETPEDALRRIAENAPVVEGVVLAEEKEEEEPNTKDSGCFTRKLVTTAIFILLVLLAVLILALALPWSQSKKDEVGLDIKNKTASPTETMIIATQKPSLLATPFPTQNAESFQPSTYQTQSPTTTAPTTDAFQWAAMLVYGGDIDRIPTNPSSPQWRALHWLAEVDQSFAYIQNVHRLRRRHALVTFYFATGGET